MPEPVDSPHPWFVRWARSAAHYVSANTALVLVLAVGTVLVIGFAAASAGVYDAVAERDGISGVDQPILDWMIRHRTPLLVSVVNGFTQLGGPIGMSIIASAITLLMIWRWRSWVPLLLIGAAVAGSLAFTTVGKAIVGRVRPPLSSAVPPYEHAFSFPSGHTLNSTVIAGMVAYLVARQLTSRLKRVLCSVAAAVWAILMGLSRVFLGHHWATDVIFAWLLGLAWLLLLVTAFRAYELVRRARRRSGAPDLTAAA